MGPYVRRFNQDWKKVDEATDKYSALVFLKKHFNKINLLFHGELAREIYVGDGPMLFWKKRDSPEAIAKNIKNSPHNRVKRWIANSKIKPDLIDGQYLDENYEAKLEKAR